MFGTFMGAPPIGRMPGGITPITGGIGGSPPGMLPIGGLNGIPGTNIGPPGLGIGPGGPAIPAIGGKGPSMKRL